MTKMDMFYEPDAGSQKRNTNLPKKKSGTAQGKFK